jgi:hypothetical protein
VVRGQPAGWLRYVGVILPKALTVHLFLRLDEAISRFVGTVRVKTHEAGIGPVKIEFLFTFLPYRELQLYPLFPQILFHFLTKLGVAFGK